ncbi:endopeptidase La [Ruminococcaceae bacterium OttesenSCG-928-I18]|nr:endopeptidase La [Ruminococcaceae bacterium OttesenSCG-928-I18]
MAEKVKVKLKSGSDVVRLPAIALRGLVVFPSNVIHFEVGRAKSIAAIESAMTGGNSLFLITQKDMDVDSPGIEDLYSYGVVAEVKQILRVSDELVKVIVEGRYRAKLIALDTEGDYLVASTKSAPVRPVRAEDSPRAEALVRSIKEAFEKFYSLNPRIPKDVIYNIITGDSALFLSEYIPANLLFKYEDKQEILNTSSLLSRLEKILALLQRENEILSIEKDINEKVSEQMDKNQRDYYLREQMRAIAGELDESEDTRGEAEKYKERILELKLGEEAEEKLLKEADRLSRMQGSSQEASVIRTYLDTCLDLPWNTETVDNLDINNAAQTLDRDHYGLKKVKERILELLSVRKLTPDVKSQIICLVGPPGVGKTSIAHSIAEALGRKYARMSLGGVRDEAEIRGHRRTYIGAMPGKLISAISTSKSRNPLLLLDEIDKLASDFRGDPAAALLEALDPEQNKTFKDHYLDIPFDLSDVLFITTANDTSTIPRPLLDRMDVIELGSYTRVEKFNIAKRHLLPKQLVKNGLKGKVRITDGALYELIDGYTQEAGVRTLERTLTEVLRKCAKSIASGEKEKITVGVQSLEKLLGPKRNKPSYFSKANEVGIANGLAWTSVGGEILPIEVQIVEKGTGKLELTGSLGDVMKESARLAITYAKARAEQYGYDVSIFKDADIHIHAPEGAIPKDGPSAGITLTTALISVLSGRPVHSNVAMTGEITLHGNVLPIGGLKEKSMAAYREGMQTVIIPKDNLPDLYDIDDEVKQNIKFVPVSTLEEAFAVSMVPAAKSPNKSRLKKKKETPKKHPINEPKGKSLNQEIPQ